VIEVSRCALEYCQVKVRSRGSDRQCTLVQRCSSVTFPCTEVQYKLSVYAVCPLGFKVPTWSTVTSISSKVLGVLNFTGYNQTSRLPGLRYFTWYRCHFPVTGPVARLNTHLRLIPAGSFVMSLNMPVLTSCSN